jgi:sec-independent protein translocase protein TatA
VFGNLGFGELMVILVIVLVLFGAKRVPEISASFGKGIREFKKNLSDVESSIMDTRAQPPIGDHSSESEPVARSVTYHDDAAPEPKRLL